ncbi:MAG: hypothetical protein ACYDC1_13065 [Limisphaerales bacterium]
MKRSQRTWNRLLLSLGLTCLAIPAIDAQNPPRWDNFSDTWTATDALGRRVPGHADVGAPRADRTVGLFYFLWHGAHIQGGPYDVTQILAQDPEAMRRPDSPLWGPLHAPHHWGESLFGYYLTQDEGVLRKHAQMLGDAGVDVVVFDVTNQLTYRDDYQALLRVWAEVRAQGNRTPQVAFLAPFWDPAKVVRELWRDLYEPGRHRDLWFQWEGKPLILADPELIFEREGNAQQNSPVALPVDGTLGQSFHVDRPFRAVSGRFPTWNSTNSGVTLSLRRNGSGGELVVRERFERVADNAWLSLHLPAPQPPGTYCLEASAPDGRIGWWSHTDNTFPRGEALVDGQPVPGDRTLRFVYADGEAGRICDFFTFRKPQPDYFQGPTGPNQWSWLEVYPQHVFTNAAGAKEQMSVGVGQNAVGNRLGSMSEPGARGRSHHRGATDTRPQAVREGLNVTEQWTRALEEDPRFLFVTGWNEWIAGRFAEFSGIKLPVMFVDQFDQEHSRDIEPMRGGHGDDYFYQFVSKVRQYKGARRPAPVRPERILIDGRFDDWRSVEPEFRDTVGDPVRRRHSGWDPAVTYTNATGRNDLIAAKVSFGPRDLHFHVRTAAPVTPPNEADPGWMVLYLDVDSNPSTGWLGYDFVVNRGRTGPNQARVERHLGPGYVWESAGTAEFRQVDNELELTLPLAALNGKALPPSLEFKWADNCFEVGDWTDFTLNGDTAPNDRFNYRAILSP